ncbi:MAG TPA: hypothetical protein VIH17_03500 [Candidatus Acidoferrales bacterium]
MRRKAAAHLERGYALLILLLMVALLSFAAAVAVPRALVQGQREKEEEMIFRGEQYARAVGLFYKRFGRFPAKLEELVEPKNNIRFLRQLYKNPMSRDGEWRLLRLAPDGSILGSVMLRSGLAAVAPVGGAGLLPTTGAGPTGPLQPYPQPPDVQATPAPEPGPEEPPRAPREEEQEAAEEEYEGDVGPPGTPPPPASPRTPRQRPLPPFPPSPTVPPTGTGAPGISPTQAIGTGIIGVAGKSNRRSIRVYKNGTRYMEWEFLYDPAAEARAALERGLKQGQSQPTGKPQR